MGRQRQASSRATRYPIRWPSVLGWIAALAIAFAALMHAAWCIRHLVLHALGACGSPPSVGGAAVASVLAVAAGASASALCSPPASAR